MTDPYFCPKLGRESYGSPKTFGPSGFKIFSGKAGGGGGGGGEGETFPLDAPLSCSLQNGPVVVGILFFFASISILKIIFYIDAVNRSDSKTDVSARSDICQ